MRSRLLTAMAGAPRKPAVVLLVGSLIIMATATITNYLRSGYLSHRYLLINAAMLAPFGAGGIMVVAHWICVLGHKLRLPVWPRATTVVLVVLFAIGLLFHTLKPLHEGKAYIKQAGLFVAQQAGEDDFLITDRTLVLHYAQIDGEVLSVGRGTFLARVNQPGVGSLFIAVSDRGLAEYLSDQLALAPAGRYARHDRPDSDGDAIVIFRLERE